MKILIVSGFLGAGKTSFIQSLIKQTGKDFAILENEYGSENIDGQRFTNEKLNIWELTENCICCSGKSDLVSSVLTIANSIDPQYLIIEPTGIGKLSNIISNLQKIEYEKISILSPITIVDIDSFSCYCKQYSNLYLDQIENSSTIVISKCEMSSTEEKQAIMKRVRQYNNKAEIISDHYSSLTKDKWLSFLNKSLSQKEIIVQKEVDLSLMDSFAINSVYMDSPLKLVLFLEQLIRNEFGDILRAKGQLKVGNEKLQFDSVSGKYSITGFSGVTDGKAVFIGKNINREKIRKYFLRKYAGVKLKNIKTDLN